MQHDWHVGHYGYFYNTLEDQTQLIFEVLLQTLIPWLYPPRSQECISPQKVLNLLQCFVDPPIVQDGLDWTPNPKELYQ